MTAMRTDPDAQDKGVVIVILNYNSYTLQMEIYDGAMQVDNVLPYRAGGAHYCFTDPALRPFVAGFQVLIKEDDRYRLRIHHGTPKEIDFELATYGIPLKSAIHVSKDGTSSDNTWHHEWLELMRVREEREQMDHGGERVKQDVGYDDDEDIIVPRRFDVLAGQYSAAREHTGTLRALHIVEMHFEEYEKLGKYQKTDVAEKIISIIHESGGRFLKQNMRGGPWHEMDEIEARKKVAHWFRHSRTKRQQQQIPRGSPDDKCTATLKRDIPRVSPVDTSFSDEGGQAADDIIHPSKKVNTEVLS